jgi:transposase-like protein
MARDVARPAAERAKWGEPEARAALEEWKRSGQTEHAFARQRGFSPQRLRYWRSRLRAPTAKRTSAAPPAFVAVAMPVAARETSKIEIHVGALLVCVREELEVEHLARIVDALARLRAC